MELQLSAINALIPTLQLLIRLPALNALLDACSVIRQESARSVILDLSLMELVAHLVQSVIVTIAAQMRQNATNVTTKCTCTQILPMPKNVYFALQDASTAVLAITKVLDKNATHAKMVTSKRVTGALRVTNIAKKKIKMTMEPVTSVCME